MKKKIPPDVTNCNKELFWGDFTQQSVRYQVRQDDQDAECVLVREEEDQEELDEIHEALQPRLNPADCSPLLLLQLLLEYLVDCQVCQPEAKPAGDDPCSQYTLSV